LVSTHRPRINGERRRASTALGLNVWGVSGLVHFRRSPGLKAAPDETRRTRLAKTTHPTHSEVVVMDQTVQIVGALIVLAAFAAAQFRLLDPRSYPYLLLNMLGSAVLAVLAYEDQQVGFLLLETVWSLVSFVGLVTRAREKKLVPTAH
jgi:hypothetical protein